MTQLTFNSTGYLTSGKYPTKDTQIISFHGDPFGASMEDSLGDSVRASFGFSSVGRGGVLGGLHKAGYRVYQPWFSTNWGTDGDYYDQGGHGISVVDDIFPTGMVHVVGTSMGGFNACVWASQNVDRVASLTLVSPAVDMMSEFDAMRGNAILNSVCEEFCQMIAGNKDADRATFESALNAKGFSRQQFATALTPIANKIFIVSAINDVVVPISGPQTLATELGLPPERAVFFDTGSPSDRHPAPYRADLGWDRHTTLRQVARNNTPAPSTTWHTVFPWAYSWVADDLSVGAVSSWTDGVGSQVLAQATSSKQPVMSATSGANSQPGVTFDGSDDFLQNTTVTMSQPNTLVLVLKLNNATTGNWVTDGGMATNQRLAIVSGKWRVYATGVAVTSAVPDTSWHTYLTAFNTTTNFVVDGVNQYSGTAPGTAGMDKFTLGSGYYGTSNTSITVSAIGIISGDARNYSQYPALKSLVNTKWGLTLPAPAPSWHDAFAWDASWVADDLAPGAVSNWLDGQAGVSLAQATSSNQPTASMSSGINGQPGVTFDGDDGLLSTFGISQSDSVVIVMKLNQVSGATQWIYTGGQYLSQRSSQWQANGGTWLVGPSTDTASHAIITYFNGVSSVMRIDGSTVASGNAGSNAMANLSVGSTISGNSPRMTISAIGIVSGDITSSAGFSALQSFVSSKWGLTL